MRVSCDWAASPTHFLLHAWAASDFNAGLTLDVGVSCDFSVLMCLFCSSACARAAVCLFHRSILTSIPRSIVFHSVFQASGTCMSYWWCAVLHPNSWDHDVRWPRLRLGVKVVKKSEESIQSPGRNTPQKHKQSTGSTASVSRTSNPELVLANAKLPTWKRSRLCPSVCLWEHHDDDDDDDCRSFSCLRCLYVIGLSWRSSHSDWWPRAFFFLVCF